MPRKVNFPSRRSTFFEPLSAHPESQLSANEYPQIASLLPDLSGRDFETDFLHVSDSGVRFRADLAVFEKDKPHTADRLNYIVDKNTKDEKIAVRTFNKWFQEFPGLIGAIWEKDKLPHFYSNHHGVPTPVPSLPDIPKETRRHSGRTIRDASDLTANLLALHNYIYANEGFSSYEAFSEILKLMFVKMEDERQNGDLITRRFYIDDEEFASAMKDASGPESDRFAERINGLFEKAKSDYPAVFRNSDALHLRLSNLAFAVSRFQELDLAHSPSDVKGVAFQKIVGPAHRGERGQFITPYPVVRLMVNFLEPKREEIILDPACGTGSFLMEAIRYMKQSDPETERNHPRADNVHGIEINQAVARVAMMQMILFGGNPEHILCADALQEDWQRMDGATSEADIILTNPPFGSQGRISLQSLLNMYDLGHRWEYSNGSWEQTSRLLSAQIPDILFIERCLQLLRVGGRMGIVLPNGDLENSSLGYVRQFIKNSAEVSAVVSLPQETFVPYGTGVKASVLFLQKRQKGSSKKRGKVFFGIVKNVGYEGGKHSAPKYQTDANGNILKDENGQPLLHEDVTNMIDEHSAFLRTNNVSPRQNIFTCSSGEIQGRLDPNYYMPEYAELVAKLRSKGAVPLKSVVKVVTRKSESLRHPEKQIRYVELSDVDPRYPAIVNATKMAVFEAPSRASYDIRQGDIITAVSGNSTGTIAHATAYVTKEYEGCICSNGFRVIRATHIDPLYLLCYMKTEEFLKQVYRFRTGAAIPAINDSDLADVLVLLPSQEDQARIAGTVKRSFKLREEALEIIQTALTNIG
ncbi:N-6 DNA methylase [Candidatus Bathyarchaeota archaeon]|nr:N-6 DNA methylase [Candidatus Bathyarchaeota archaeon]